MVGSCNESGGTAGRAWNKCEEFLVGMKGVGPQSRQTDFGYVRPSEFFEILKTEVEDDATVCRQDGESTRDSVSPKEHLGRRTRHRVVR